MAGFSVEFSKGAAKDFKRLPEQYKILIRNALQKLSDNKHLDIKPLRGEKDIFRIRIGRYRVLYIQIKDVLLITRIAHRKDAYK